MHPFSYRNLIVLALLLLTLAVGTWLQGIDAWWLRTILICLAVLVIYLLPVLALRISDDLNQSLLKIFTRVKRAAAQAKYDADPPSISVAFPCGVSTLSNATDPRTIMSMHTFSSYSLQEYNKLIEFRQKIFLDK